MNLHVVLLALAALVVLPACKKDPEIVPETTPVALPPTAPGQGKLALRMQPTFGGSELVFANRWYRNAAGDSLVVVRLNYYLSNLRLKRADGSYFRESESYHLLKHSSNKNGFTVNAVPAGTYTALEFLIGVDSVRNKSGAQTGDLDVKEDMFWDWNQGYIFFKIEGDYKSAATTSPSPYGLHLGFSPNARKAVLVLPSPLVVREGGESVLSLVARVDSVFNASTDLDLDTYSALTTKSSGRVADNCQGMFEVVKVEN